MAKHNLRHPIEIDGKTITTVTLRRPKGRDMVAVGDHIAVLARFYAANAKVVSAGIAKAAAAGAAAAQGGASAPPADEAEELAGIDASALTPPDAAVYRAMVAVVGQIADLGEAAGDLDMADLQALAAQALAPGEA